MKVNGLLELKFQLQAALAYENTEVPISDYNYNNKSGPLLFLFIFVAIVIRLCLLHLAETRAPYNGNDTFDQSLKIFPEDQSDITSEGSSENFKQSCDGSIVVYDNKNNESDKNDSGNNKRYGACAFCGNLTTTKCSQCKIARYCSVECQIRHWRSVHKYECVKKEKQAQDASSIIKKTKKAQEERWILSNREEPNGEVGERERERERESNNIENETSGESLCNSYSCGVCGAPATTRCSRCNAVRYCSAKCLIEDWGWHKGQCISDQSDLRDELLKNSSKEEDHHHHNHHSARPLPLDFYPEGTTTNKSLIISSQEPTKKAQDLVVERVGCHEEEAAKSRNEIKFLQSECHKWAMHANFAKERYQSFKKEIQQQLFVLKNEKELISKAEAQSRMVVRSLHERLHKMQIKYDQLEKELQESHEHIQQLTTERDECHKAAQIAMTKVEAKGKELQVERECSRQLKENCLRDVSAAESRAIVAEAKLQDLDRKIRLKNKKACPICLTNEKDLAFGCGHMTCRDCGSKISKCPICREHITSAVRLFPG